MPPCYLRTPLSRSIPAQDVFFILSIVSRLEDRQTKPSPATSSLALDAKPLNPLLTIRVAFQESPALFRPRPRTWATAQDSGKRFLRTSTSGCWVFT